jgi:hypothetical protein
MSISDTGPVGDQTDGPRRHEASQNSLLDGPLVRRFPPDHKVVYGINEEGYKLLTEPPPDGFKAVHKLYEARTTEGHPVYRIHRSYVPKATIPED